MARDLVVVEFIGTHGSYYPGVRAGFSPGKARQLVETKLAVYVDKPKPKAAVTKDKPKASQWR